MPSSKTKTHRPPRSRPGRSRSRPDPDPGPGPALPPRTNRNGNVRNGRDAAARRRSEGILRLRRGGARDPPPPPPFPRSGEDAPPPPAPDAEGPTERIRRGTPSSPRRPHFAGFRGDYSVGDAPRCPSHVLLAESPAEAHEAARSLRRHDFAFVRRSDGTYSYAILAYRFVRPVARGGAGGRAEECLVFVTSEAGATKVVSERHWRDDNVRRVAAMEDVDRQASCQEQGIEPDGELPELCWEAAPPPPPAAPGWRAKTSEDAEVLDDVPPNVVTILPRADEECSMFSSVSERARGAPQA